MQHCPVWKDDHNGQPCFSGARVGFFLIARTAQRSFAYIFRWHSQHHRNDRAALWGKVQIFDVQFNHVITQSDRLHKNLHVVANHVITNEEGIIVAFAEPLIHTFNKNEMSLAHDKTATWFGNIAEKKNVILLGDSLGTNFLKLIIPPYSYS